MPRCLPLKGKVILIVSYFILCITPDYSRLMSSDLMHYITKKNFNVSWYAKATYLHNIIYGLYKVHDVNIIIHRDLHSEIFF